MSVMLVEVQRVVHGEVAATRNSVAGPRRVNDALGSRASDVSPNFVTVYPFAPTLVSGNLTHRW